MALPRGWWVPALIGFAGSSASAADLPSLAAFQARAAAHGTVFEVPALAHSPAELQAKTEDVLREADARLAAIAALTPNELTFDRTLGALDAVVAAVKAQSMMLYLQREAHVEAEMRAQADPWYTQVENWMIALDYRDDVYRVITAFAATSPRLEGEQRRLLEEKLRDYRRAGLGLPSGERREVERLRKELAATVSAFSRNINEARGPVDYTAEELAGVPPSLLEAPGVKQPDGRCRVLANVTWQLVAVDSNASNAETRRRLYVARNTLAKETNTAVLHRMVNLRADLARRLGYATWADFKLETRMAKNAATARKFEEDLAGALQGKYTAELETLRAMKAKDLGRADVTVEPWDTGYYLNQLTKQKYAVDAEQLRVYFPYEATLQGMFRIYERLFGLAFAEVACPDSWAPGVRLYAVSDSRSGQPLGLFYLDMFPREGKFNHFACFGLRSGRYLADGRFESPVVTFLCNFPPPTAAGPSLLTHGNVVTLFHEFGHVMHALLGRSRYVSLSSDAVPQDFMEAPSQMLENWAWDKAMLDTFAADYRDPSRKIPAETIAALARARLASEGILTRRQLSVGLVDLALHAPAGGKPPADLVAATNAVLSRVTLPVPPETTFVTYFGHMGPYEASYYGYLWAKVISLDMAGVFKSAPGGFLDENVGRRLRDEVYGVGNTRDAGESVERFLGRPTNNEAYLQSIGIR